MKFLHQTCLSWIAGLMLVGGCGTPVQPMASPSPVLAPATKPTTTTTPVGDGYPTTTDPRQTIPFLASDALAGRLPGTPGLQTAGDFLAAELNRIGVQPLPGQGGYFQPFSMGESSTLAPSTHLSIGDQKLVISNDFAPMPVSAEGSFQGKLAFVGFGITRDKDDPSHYDDYAGIDVHGKVVLAMMKEPLDDKGASRFAGGQSRWSNSALFTVKAKTAADHGAIALLVVAPPASGGPDVVNPYYSQKRSDAAIPVIQITRRTANTLLGGGGGMGDLKSLQDQINSSFKPDSMDLPQVEISGSIKIDRAPTDVRNIAAYLPGTGPHADEWIIVGAHYDHLGNGQLGHMVSGRAGSIWHGADDNASGTAAVLELAERMKHDATHGAPLPRSVLFLFFTGEEEGLIGSDYFVKHPLVPLENVVAMLNLDMVGRLRGNSLQIGGAGTAANWDSIITSAVAGTGLTTTTALPDDGGRGGLGPSDHMSFAMHKIPVLFLFTGMHADYHRPTDTADKINYDGVDELVGVSQKMVLAMSTMPRQQYDSSSDSNSMTRLVTGNTSHRAVLGVVPDDASSSAIAGVPISDVVPNGPAEKAGLRAGDIITGVNAKPVKSLSDLSEALTEAHGGEKVMVKVLRDGKPMEFAATLQS